MGPTICILAILLVVVSVLTEFFGSSPTLSVSAAQVVLIFLFYGTYSFVWTPLAIIYLRPTSRQFGWDFNWGLVAKHKVSPGAVLTRWPTTQWQFH